MDGITDKMMIGEGGFDPASIKKTDRGDYYGLEWELFMGQKFALAQPPVAECKAFLLEDGDQATLTAN